MTEEIFTRLERPLFASIEEEVDFETTLERVAAAAARGWRLKFYLGARGFRFFGLSATGGKVIGQALFDKKSALKSVLNGIEDEHLLKA